MLGLLGQVPSFPDFIEYVDHSSSPEWRALGNAMPSFLAFMGFKLNVKVQQETTVGEEEPVVDESVRHKSSVYRSVDVTCVSSTH